MPTFDIKAPDGKTYRVTGPEGSTAADALARVKSQVVGATTVAGPASAPQEAPIASDEGDSGIVSAFKSSPSKLGAAGEGVYRTMVEGPGQLISAVAQAPFSAYDALRTGEPFKQMEPSATILPDYNEAVKAQRAGREAEHRARFGEDMPGSALAIGEFLGGGLAAPEAKAPEGTIKIIQAMRRSVAHGAKVGALASGASFQDAADTVQGKLLWTAGGGLLGSAIGVVPSVGSGIQTAFRKYLTASPITGAPQAAAELEATIPGLKGLLNAAQETGNANVQKFLNRSAGKYAQEQLLSQTEELEKHLKNLDAVYGKFRPAEEVIAEGQKALTKQRDHMVTVRNDMWKADIKAMRTKLTADVIDQGGVEGSAQAPIALPEMLDGFKQITEDFVNRGGNALTPGFQKILDEYKAFNGHLSFDSLEHLLRLTSGNSGSILAGTSNPDAQKAAGKQLRSVVFGAIDKMDDQSEIGSMLKTMRAGYAARSKEIKDFNDMAASKILNVPKGGIVAKPEQAVDRLLELPESEIAKLSAVLDKSSPQTVSALRSANIRNAYQEALLPNAKPGTPSWNLDKFLKATVQNGKLRAAGLYTDAQKEVLTKNIVALRPLLQKTAQGANTPEAESTLMAGISMAPAFVARVLFRLTAQGGVDKLLFDPASYQKFKAVDTLFQSKRWDQAASALSHMSDELSAQQDNPDDE